MGMTIFGLELNDDNFFTMSEILRSTVQSLPVCIYFENVQYPSGKNFHKGFLGLYK